MAKIKVYPISYIIHFQQPTKKQTDSSNFTFSLLPTSISALQKTLKQPHLLFFLLFFFPNNNNNHKTQPKYQTPIKSCKEQKKSHANVYIYMREREGERERSSSLRNHRELALSSEMWVALVSQPIPPGVLCKLWLMLTAY